ncbi:MAG: OprO/OprP family phosphate-selective porin [Bacteroidales bacterium]|nr:OprO/OprP family phosphate-selective porin [Bacteroidales bacterium]
MKKILTLLFVAFCTISVNAQQQFNTVKGTSLFEEVSGIKKKTDKFNFYMNMNGSFDAMFNDNGFDYGKFNMRQLRIEAKGNVNEWLSYRWRQRLNRPNNGGDNIDNLPTSIDIAGIGVKLGDKFSIFAGKQCAAYGGFEFDANPIEIYEYSDMIEYMSNFMTGINIGYDFTDKQQLNFQVLNSLNGDFYSMYGEFNPEMGIFGEGVVATPSKLPLVYTLNWNGNFANIYKTRWSASIMSQAEGKNLYYFALGNELTLGKFNMYFDVMYSNDAIDRSGIMTEIVGEVYGHNIFKTSYLSLVTKLNYRFAEKWNVFVKGMYETASVVDHTDPRAYPFIINGKYRTSLGYLGGIEYYPMESNLHFFLTYVGRHYMYEEIAVGHDDYSTNRVSLGFIYQLPMF